MHLDIVGRLTDNEGYCYLVTIIDRYTRWPEALPVKNITAETVARTFMSYWVARYGVPQTLTTDRGAQFKSALWKSLLKMIVTCKIRTTAYHPMYNGIVERFHKKLKEALKTKEYPHYWLENLPLILLGIRTTVEEDLGYSSSELIYGETLTGPGQYVCPSENQYIDTTQYLDRLRQFLEKIGPAQSRLVNKPGTLDKNLM